MHDDADDGSINGNRYIPFTGLIRLEKQPQQRRAADDGSPATFRSLAKAFAPGGGTSAYGGHVFAQAVWAAAHTVKDGFVVHNVTGFFTLPGNTAFPFIYTVRTVRDGGRYCTRTVEVVQEHNKTGICFTCTCSFKRDETASVDCQEQVDLRELYKVALGDKRPDEWPEAPGVDSPWYWEASAKNDNYTDPFPGLSLRKVDMSAYNAPRKPLDRRQLQFYTTIGSMPPASQDANLHACAHLYASDRNGLFVITNHLGAGDDYSAMATLSHSVVFHVGAKELEMAEQDGRDARKWYCQESRDGLVKMEKTGQLAEKLQERFGPSVAREKL
ncbi:Acyl-CoA thioesterase [Neofusicoccum parvum]|uniref:Acyl-CoA thioesterase n=1 Tax=Neofusicoccum parvum TaxID=310453 RepID=A0ACB5S0V8_9PEZI|nr:Acyl-CoA thioesterase [Neofusicoccum parvum]GME48148.1 Acyl-CoA thioesterase [Neofusicoccum parvum]